MEIISWRLHLYELPNLYRLLHFSKIYSSIRAGKISNENIAEKSTKISLKTLSNFQSPSSYKDYSRLLRLMETQWVHVL